MILPTLLCIIFFQNCLAFPILNIQQTAQTDSESLCKLPELDVSQITDIVCTQEKLSSTSVLQRKMNKEFELEFVQKCEYIPAQSVSDLYLTLGVYKDLLSEFSSDADVMDVLPLLQQLVLTLNSTVDEYCGCPCHSSKCSNMLTFTAPNSGDLDCLLIGADNLIRKFYTILKREKIIPNGTCEICNRIPEQSKEDISGVTTSLNGFDNQYRKTDECFLNQNEEELNRCALQSKFKTSCNGSNPVAVHGALMFYVNQTLQRLHALPSGTSLPVIMNISAFMDESIIPITKPIVEKKCNNSCKNQGCTLTILEGIADDLDRDLSHLQCPMQPPNATSILHIYCLMNIVHENFVLLKHILEGEELLCTSAGEGSSPEDKGTAQEIVSSPPSTTSAPSGTPSGTPEAISTFSKISTPSTTSAPSTSSTSSGTPQVISTFSKINFGK